MANESTKWLYSQLRNRGYNVGATQQEFDNLMANNAESRKWAYNTAKASGLNVGADLNEFTSLVAPSTSQRTTTPKASAPRTAPHKVAASPQGTGPKPAPYKSWEDLIEASDPASPRNWQNQQGAKRKEAGETVQKMLYGKNYIAPSYGFETPQDQANRKKAMQEGYKRDAQVKTVATYQAKNTPAYQKMVALEARQKKGEKLSEKELNYIQEVRNAVDDYVNSSVSEAREETRRSIEGNQYYNRKAAQAQKYYGEPVEVGTKLVDGENRKEYMLPDGTRTTDQSEVDAATKRAEEYRKQLQTKDEIAAIEEEIEALKARMDDRAAEVHEDWSRDLDNNDAPLAAVLAADTYSTRQLTDKEKSALRVAIRQKEEQLSRLKKERDRAAGKSVGFWWDFGHVVGDIRTWDFGMNDFMDAMTMAGYEYYTSPNATEKEKEAGKKMMQAIYDNEQTQAQYADNDTFLNRIGSMTGNMLPYVVDFLLTGGGFEVVSVGSKAAGKAATKMFGEEVSKVAMKQILKDVSKEGVKQYVKKTGVRQLGKMAGSVAVKTFGTAADDTLIRAPLMTNTIQIGKTASDVVDRKLGGVEKDENGNISFTNDKTWGSAVWQAEANSITENASEMFGAHLDGVVPALAKTFGGKRISGMLARASASDFGRILSTTSRHFQTLGVSDYFGEVSEEYYGQLWRTALNLDDAYTEVPVLDENGERMYDEKGHLITKKENLLMNGQFHGDLWGGMGLSMGLMGAGKYGISGVRYGRLKRDVNKASKEALKVFTPDVWNPLRKIIDNTDNESMGTLAKSVITDRSLSKEQRDAAMNYMERTLYLRGNNLADVAKSRVDKDSEEGRRVGMDSALSMSYLTGYNRVSDEDIPNIESLYNERRKQAESEFDPDFLLKLDEDPVETLAAMSSDENYTQPQINAALEYANTRELWKGMNQRLSDELEDQEEAAGKPVGRAVMRYDGREVEVLSGRVVMTDDGTMVDKARSDKTVVIRDPATGKPEMVAPEAIGSYEEIIDEVDGVNGADMADPSAAASAQSERESARVEPHSKYTSGQIKIRNSDGTETRGNLTGYVDENGNHEYKIEGDLMHLHYASEQELDNILSEYVPDDPDVDTSAAASAQSERVESEPKPVGKGVFGEIYDSFKGKAKDAVRWLFGKKSGEAKGVFHRDEVGDIGLIWGDDRGGLQHIIEKHVIEHSDYNSVEELTSAIEDVVSNGDFIIQKGGNLRFEKGGHRVIVAKNQEGDFVVTAYDNSRSLSEKKRTEADATLFRQRVLEEMNGTPVSPSSGSNGEVNASPSNKQAYSEAAAIPFGVNDSFRVGVSGREESQPATVIDREGENVIVWSPSPIVEGSKRGKTMPGYVSEISRADLEQLVERDAEGNPVDYAPGETDEANGANGADMTGANGTAAELPAETATRAGLEDRGTGDMASRFGEGGSSTGEMAMPAVEAEEQGEEPTLQSQEDTAPVEANDTEGSALDRIPVDENGKHDFGAVDADTAWDGLVEKYEGNTDRAQGFSANMVKIKEAALKKAEKAKSKPTEDPDEWDAAERAREEAVEQARRDLEHWRSVAGVEQRRQSAIRAEQEAEARRLAAERAEAERAEREAREEAARREREALEGIPEWHLDTPENARKRGVRRFGGQMFTRQEPMADFSSASASAQSERGGIAIGKEIEVKFSQSDLPKGHVAVIEASQLQPSHIQGQRNPMFFIEEAQPKNRAEGVSMNSAKEIAEGIRPQEITASATAYTGAPTVNTRGEVIQGNNRSDALRYLWENRLPEQQQAYKQYLIDNAEQFGLDPEAVNAMEQPVLVNMLDASDAEALRLGQMTAQDTESGGIERIKPKNVAQRLGENMRMFASRLLKSGDEEASFGQLVDNNGTEVLKWMNQIGAISATQYQSAFDSKGNLTPEAKNDLQKVLYQSVFRGGSQQLEEMFEALPAKAQKSLLSTAFRDMDSPAAGQMLPEIQASIVAYTQLMSDPVFANARKMEEVLRAIEAFKQTIALDDRLEQYVPSDYFSNFALHLAGLYKASDMSQKTLTSYFNQMYDLAQGKKEASLFEEADTTQHPLAEVIKQVLGIDYKPAKNGNNNVANGGADVALRNQVGQGGELRGNEPPSGREQNPAGTEPSERGARAAGDSREGGNAKERQNNLPKDEVTSAERTEMAARIVDWLSDENLSNALGKTRDEIFEEFGNELKPIAYIHSQFVSLVSPFIADPRIYCGKGYFIDHALRNHGAAGTQVTIEDVDVSKYLNIQAVLDNPDTVKETTVDGKRTVIFIKKIGRFFAELTQVEEDGKIVLHKSLFNQKKEPYAKLNDIRQKNTSSEGGTSSISHTENSAPAISLESRGDVKGKLVWKHADDVSTASDVADGLYSSQGNMSDPASEGTDAPQTNQRLSERKVNDSASNKQAAAAESLAQSSDREGEKSVQGAVEAASAEVNTDPTEAQKKAGNYKMGHVRIDDFDITIENPAGSVRKGKDADGKEWRTTMANTYGYIRGTESVDGDHIDVFLHSDMDQWDGRKVFVVDQTNTDGSFDEHKVMLGFNDKDEAMTAYLANYDKTWAQTHPGLRISETNIEDFNKWIQSSHRKTKPFADYTTVSKVTDEADKTDKADSKLSGPKTDTLKLSSGIEPKGTDRPKNAATYEAAKGLVESAGIPVVEVSGMEAQQMIGQSSEEFVNKKPQQVKEGVTMTTQLSAPHSDVEVSDAKVDKKSEGNNEAVKFHIQTYHGSHADFTAFDFSHVGEGEGHQAFGWGGYVTEVENVGRVYARAAAKRPLLDGKHFDHSQEGREFPSRSIESVLMRCDGDVDKAIEWYEHLQHRWDSVPHEPGSKQPVSKEAAEWLIKNRDRISMEPRHLYKVDIPDDTGGNYFEWSGRADRVIDRLGISEAEYEKYDMATGENVYNYLAEKLGSEKAASEYLAEHGYTGIKYAVDYFAGGNTEGKNNYVIFREGDMRISDHVRFLKTGNSEVYGWTVGGKVYLNRDAMDPETPLHEYTHLWDEMVQQENPELWARGKELMKQTAVWHEVLDDPNYSDIRDDEDAVASEVHSRLTGKRGAERIEEMTKEALSEGDYVDRAKKISLIQELKNWLSDMFKSLKQTLGKWNKQDLDNLTADDFADMTLRDLAEGMNPRTEMRRGEQMRTVTRKNPMQDDYHTGIRSREDVKSYDEILKEAESAHKEFGSLTYPDMDIDMLREAGRTGMITVYSSKPIEPGNFVTPSRMNAEDYSGGGKIYTKRVPVGDVAWISEDEGQFAPVEENRGREEFEAMRERAVAERGLVMPGLNDASVRVVEVPRHDFTGTGKEALKAAEKWAKENIVGMHRATDSHGDSFEYSISNDAVEKYVSKSATGKSENIGVHLAALKKLPEIIGESVEAEVHPDYKKGKDEIRDAENGHNPSKLVHRFYGAISLDGKIFRVKTTIEEFSNKAFPNSAHSYEVTEIEAFIEGPMNTSNNGALTSASSREGILGTAKLLQGVEKSYDPGKKLLEESVKADAMAESSPAKNGRTQEEPRYRFIGETGAKRLDEAMNATFRLDNLKVARNMESAGKSSKEIKLASGWERGVDGKWRYEEPDGKYYHPKNTDGIFKLGDIWHDDNLYISYPKLKDTEVEYVSTGSYRGLFYPLDNKIKINTARIGNRMDLIRSVLVHEIQHAIQQEEGFATGGTGEYAFSKIFGDELSDFTPSQLRWLYTFRNRADELMKAGKYKRLPYAIRSAIKEAKDNNFYPFDDYDKRDDVYLSVEEALLNFTADQLDKASYFDRGNAYRRIAGEVEARNVQERLNYKDKRRRTLLAEETEDIAREDQIILEKALQAFSMDSETASRFEETEAKRARIEKLRASEPVEVTDTMIPQGLDLTDRKEVQKNLLENVRGEYVNSDTGEKLKVLRQGIEEVTHHGMTDPAHVKSLFAIPDMLRNAIFIDEQTNAKGKRAFDSYRYYVCGLKIDGEDYTAKIVVGVKDGQRYYDHRLTQIEKGAAIEKAESFRMTAASNNTPSDGYKGTTLESLLQVEDGFRPRERAVEPPAETASRSEKTVEGKADATSIEAKGAHAAELAQRLNTPIRVVRDVAELTNSDSRIQIQMRSSRGFYDPVSGEVVIVLPNHADVEDVAATVFHEVVGHKDLRELIGEENYDAFCDEVYTHLKDELKSEVDRETTHRFLQEPEKGYEHARRVAVDELFGRMAEKGFEDFTKAERGVWAKLKAKVLEAINRFLGSLKLPKWVRLGDNELRYMLWKSHEKLRSRGDLVGKARDAAKRDELGLNKSDVIRESKRTESIDEINNRFNEQIDHWESGEMAGKDFIEAGRPMGVMRQFMPDGTITLRQKVLTKSRKKHGLTAEDIKGLPGALARPIFVFKSTPETISVLTELKSATGQNLFVAVEIGVNKQFGHRTLEVNDILTIHGREAENIILPIVDNNTLVWADKEKGLEWLSSAKSNSQAIAAQTLDDAAKVVKSFKNPTIREEINTKEGVSQRVLSLMKSEHLTSVTDGATLLDGAKLPKFFEDTTNGGEEKVEYRFRDGSNGQARKEYDRRVRSRRKKDPNDKKAEKPTNRLGQLHEAYFDSMRSLRVLQEAICHECGCKIESHEDAYELENQMSSRNKAMEEEYMNEYAKPILNAIAAISKGKGQKKRYAELVDYVIAKHGLERNAFMRNRDIANGVDADKANSTDYAGLTSLTEENDVAEAERKATQMVADYEALVDTSTLWKSINAATKATLTTRYTSGLLSRDMFDTIRTQYRNYIPLKGWADTVSADIYEYSGGGYGLGSALKKAYGRNSVADDPFATIFADAQRTIMEANRNIMKQRFLNLALNHPTDLLTVSKQWYVKQADGTWIPNNPVIPADTEADVVDSIVKHHEASMKTLESKGKASRVRSGLQLGLRTAQNEPSQHIVKVKRNGEEFCVFVNGDPRAARAINGMLNPDAGEKTKIAKIAQNVKNFMSRAFTSWNPEFTVSNLSRDLIFATSAVVMKEDARYAGRYALNTGKLLKFKLPVLLHKWKHGKLTDDVEVERLFKEFMRNGGETGFTQLHTVDKVKKDMQRFIHEAQGGISSLMTRPWRGFWNLVESMNRAAEDLTRFAVYMTSRQSGRTISRSISDAKDITVNFNRKGSGALGARYLNFLYVFFNACMQSMSNFGRIIKNHPLKASATMATFMAAGLWAPIVSNLIASLFGDNDSDDYWYISEWERRSNMCLNIPFTNVWLKIPLPHELRPFYAIGEISYSVMMGHETVEDGLIKGVESFSGMMPIDWTGNDGDNVVNFTPTIAQPLVQEARNVDYFGKPIYKENPWNEGDPEWSKAYKGTNSLLVSLTKMLSEKNATTDEYGVTTYPNHWYTGDINPAIVEHFLESYSGGLGKTVNGTGKTISMLWDEDARELRNIPIARKFLRTVDEKDKERKATNDYFKLRTEYEDYQKYFRKLNENRKLGTPGASENMTKWMASEHGERYKMLEKYMKQINKLEDKIRDSRDEALSSKLRAQIDSMRMQLLDEAEANEVSQ